MARLGSKLAILVLPELAKELLDSGKLFSLVDSVPDRLSMWQSTTHQQL
jgi:hypothetical protein